MKSAILINMIASEIKADIGNNKELHKIEQITKILPLVTKHLYIKKLTPQTLYNVFSEHKEIL
jgi:hypothetical protein